MVLLSTSFSCSYGDDNRDDDKRKKDEKKIESTMRTMLASVPRHSRIGNAGIVTLDLSVDPPRG
jgi:hypothetical protein